MQFATINGFEDIDVEFTRYNADLTVDWQEVLASEDINLPLKMAYDTNLGRVIFQFTTNGLFNGVEGVHALVVWDKSGQQLWLRQLSTFFGGIESIEPDSINGDWSLKLSSEMGKGGGHYGMGNIITIGP